MGYYRAGGPYTGTPAPFQPEGLRAIFGFPEPEADIPDPLAPDPERLARLQAAYRRMKEAEEMGYYRAGDAASDYMLAEGTLRHQRGRMPALTGMVPAGHILGESAAEGYGRLRRRMNPMNVHAARRAIRRLGSFAHIAQRIFAFTHARPARGHFKFKRKRKR